MVSKKNPEEIAKLRKAGSILARILRETKEHAKAGISTEALNDFAHKRTVEYGADPVLLGYQPTFAAIPYPASLCVSVNNVVQHGIPSDEQILKDGDLVDLDMSIRYDGMVVDAGFTFGIGAITKEEQKFLDTTRAALKAGIKEAKPGNHIGDISHAVQTVVEKKKFSVVRDLAGHGVGYHVHEEPLIPNVGKKGKGAKIQVGHVYAIEPITTMGHHAVIYDDDGDGYSIFTKDGSKSAHFEHTVVITEQGAEILTKE